MYCIGKLSSKFNKSFCNNLTLATLYCPMSFNVFEKYLKPFFKTYFTKIFQKAFSC